MVKRYLTVLALFLCLGLVSKNVKCQEADETSLYEKAFNETDPGKKQAAVLEFVQKVKKGAPETEQGVSSMYAQILDGMRKQGNWSAMASAAERFLTYRPADVPATSAATEAYQKLGNTQKLVDFGTRLYNQAPNANTAYFVAKAYQSLKDQANFIKWAQKTLQHDPNNLDMNTEMILNYWLMNDFANSAATGQKVLKIVDTYKTPAGVTDAQWKVKADQIRAFAYRAIGENSYRNNDMGNSVKSYELAAKLDKSNDFAHYRLGELYWRTSRLDDAILSYAKAFVLNGPTSTDAQKKFNELSKTRYGTNTNAVQSIIKQARDLVK